MHPMVTFAIIFWILCGVVIGMVVTIAIIKHFDNPYGYMLDWTVKYNGKIYTVVAVSHKGALAIRTIDDHSGKHAFWIPKNKVSSEIKFKISK